MCFIKDDRYYSNCSISVFGTFKFMLEDFFEEELGVSLYLNSVGKKLLFHPLNEPWI